MHEGPTAIYKNTFRDEKTKKQKNKILQTIPSEVHSGALISQPRPRPFSFIFPEAVDVISEEDGVLTLI